MMLRVVKAIWLILCLVIAIGGIRIGGEILILVFLLLTILTSPLGIITLVAVPAFLSPFKDSIVGLRSDYVAIFLMILVGYLQWFILFPKIVKRMEKEKSTVNWLVLGVFVTCFIYGICYFYQSLGSR